MCHSKNVRVCMETARRMSMFVFAVFPRKIYLLRSSKRIKKVMKNAYNLYFCALSPSLSSIDPCTHNINKICALFIEHFRRELYRNKLIWPWYQCKQFYCSKDKFHRNHNLIPSKSGRRMCAFAHLPVFAITVFISRIDESWATENENVNKHEYKLLVAYLLM